MDHLVRSVRGRQVAVVERMVDSRALPLRAWYPLIALDRGDAISQRDIARRVDLKDAAIGRTVEALEALGLVQRRPDAQDRRKSLVLLTDRGQALAMGLRTARAHLQNATQKDFSEEEREEFKDLLIRACDNLLDATKASSTEHS